VQTDDVPTGPDAALADLVTELRFLYVGTDDTDEAVAFYTERLGARQRWRFQRFGADVAAIELAAGPLLMLADHRPAGSVLPIWAVTDLDEAERRLRARGCEYAGPIGSPEGNGLVFADPSGVEWALLQVDRPGALDGVYRE
jgi:catechol 2,3-dioxygenase-like lactoylglutathione lyase family enzyme